MRCVATLAGAYWRAAHEELQQHLYRSQGQPRYMSGFSRGVADPVKLLLHRCGAKYLYRWADASTKCDAEKSIENSSRVDERQLGE